LSPKSRFSFLYEPPISFYHAVVGQGGINSSIDREWGTMITCLNDKTSQAKLEEVMSGITARIIYRDHHYLTSPKGRPRVVNTKAANTMVADTRLSHLCYYGFEGHPTGLSEYDRMFKDITEVIYAGVAKEGRAVYELDQLQQVIGLYIKYHPKHRLYQNPRLVAFLKGMRKA
jgi:hypothetical protein